MREVKAGSAHEAGPHQTVRVTAAGLRCGTNRTSFSSGSKRQLTAFGFHVIVATERLLYADSGVVTYDEHDLGCSS